MSELEKLYVTRPFLPPLDEYLPYLTRIWETAILTNCGPLHEELESQLAQVLKVGKLTLFNNGTTALIAAIRALDLEGEIITTPFSFVATANAIQWAGCEPVFADIESRGFNIDPDAVEASITPRTSAIMPVHCYGHPCDVHRIESIAKRHGLRVIYDAAHAFGCMLEPDVSLLSFGDMSALSFHATKVFNTFEGGALACSDPAMKTQMQRVRNFGFVEEDDVLDNGLNGKLSEPHAALGLAQIKYVDQVIAGRARVDAWYREALSGLESLQIPDLPLLAQFNYAYFPVLVDETSHSSRDTLWKWLRQKQIFARRYFYPCIPDLRAYSSMKSPELTNSRSIASRVLCLPIHPGLGNNELDRICNEIRLHCR